MGIIYKKLQYVVLTLGFVSIILISGCSSTPAATPAPHVSTTPAAPNTTQYQQQKDIVVSVLVDKQVVNTGETFTVSIQIDTPAAVRGSQWKLNFDPHTMRCEVVEEGAFFKDWAGLNNAMTIVTPKPNIDNGKGQVSDMGIAIIGTAKGGPEGKGVLATYQFTALNAPLSFISLSDVLLADINGKTSAVTVKSYNK